MSLAATKHIIYGLMIAAMATSCGGSTEKQEAESLLIMAETAAENGDYDRSIELIDSLDRLYSKQIETRRRGMHLKAKSIEGSTIRQLEKLSEERARLHMENDSLQKLLVKVDNPVEPYFKSSLMNTNPQSNFIEARMMPDGTPYLISNLSSPKVNHTSVTAICEGSEASTATIACDGERNDRSMGHECIHYMPGECTEFLDFIVTNQNRPITVRFNGENGKTIGKALQTNEIAAIATVRKASKIVTAIKLNELSKARLEKQLELSRNHAAQTFESNDKEK